MKKLFSMLLLAIVLYANTSYSDYELFRSVSSGDWTNGSTWEVSTNGGINWFTSAQFPNYNSGLSELRGGHNVTVPVNASVSCNQFTIRNGGTLTILTGGTVSVVADGSNYDLTLESGATLTGLGLLQTSGTSGVPAGINVMTGSNFLSPLKVATGLVYLYDAGSSLYANVRGDITVNAGATLYVLGYLGVKAFSNVLNNGTITGTTAFTMRGNSIVNNGTINTPYFYFDTTTTIGGVTGNWYSVNTTISSNGNVICENDINFTAAGLNSIITLKNGGRLNPNGHTITAVGSPASVFLSFENGSTIQNSGVFRTAGTITMDIQTGANFYPPFKIISGTTNCFSSISPYSGIVNNSLTIDSLATLTSSGSSLNDNITAFGAVTNKGVISGFNFYMKGNNLVNDGIIDPFIFYFDSTTNLSGKGSFETSNCKIQSGANVTLTSNHQFRYLNINAGGALDISSKILKLNGPGDPIINNGTFTTTSGTIEYNGIYTQYFPQLNIDYVNVNFNNPSGFEMYNNATVSGLAQVLNGDINLNTRIFTLQPTATLSETTGNTFKGDYGYLITTRNINAPNNLNVAGLGAVITSSANLGSTVIKRGHGIQNLPIGQSIQRYFEITPANNSNLNATLIYKYDDSELNGNNESNLSLFKSTIAGNNFSPDVSTLNSNLNTLTETGINSFAKYTSGEGNTGYINLSAAIEGLYNPATMKLNLSDTIIVYLRNSNSPFASVDSARSKLDSVSLTANLKFQNAAAGNYYIAVKNRNTIETWSKSPVAYNTGATLNYDFSTDAAQAFGNNETQKGTKFCIYSGDVLQDGFVDLQDLVLIFNDASSFATGYVITDLTGDRIVDLTDIVLAFNNAGAFVHSVTP